MNIERQRHAQTDYETARAYAFAMRNRMKGLPR